MAIIDKIQVSGVTYDIGGSGSGNNVVEVTQEQYDALVSAGTVDLTAFYIITDAPDVDISNYWTSAQTDSAINAAVSGKQDTLVSGTNIKTINNESLMGSGNISLVETSAITSSVTSASTDSEIPTAKAVYDAVGSGGGGSSYTAGDGIDIANNVISVTGKADTSAVTAIQDSLSGYVTTDTEQIISGRKIFTYTSSGAKAIEFKQTDDSSKVGFRVINSAATNNEVASFEFRPDTFTIDGVQHPLLYYGHYRNTNTANAGVPQTVIGFRQYDQKKAAAYHYLIPLPEKAKIPFNLTTSFKDYYAPMGFKNGSTMITADNTGVVDLSSEFSGLKLVKLSQADYTALTTKDENTVYFIGDSNGYIMKIGNATVS